MLRTYSSSWYKTRYPTCSKVTRDNEISLFLDEVLEPLLTINLAEVIRANDSRFAALGELSYLSVWFKSWLGLRLVQITSGPGVWSRFGQERDQITGLTSELEQLWNDLKYLRVSTTTVEIRLSPARCSTILSSMNRLEKREFLGYLEFKQKFSDDFERNLFERRLETLWKSR